MGWTSSHRRRTSYSVVVLYIVLRTGDVRTHVLSRITKPIASPLSTRGWPAGHALLSHIYVSASGQVFFGIFNCIFFLSFFSVLSFQIQLTVVAAMPPEHENALTGAPLCSSRFQLSFG